MQFSSILKKTLKSINKTIPGIVGVLFLLGLHLYFFTVLGMLLFPRDRGNATDTRNHSEIESKVTQPTEAEKYFSDIGTSAMSLLVLLTTANNPDGFYSTVIFTGVNMITC
jgi:two pore calcium channel protein 2